MLHMIKFVKPKLKDFKQTNNLWGGCHKVQQTQTGD